MRILFVNKASLRHEGGGEIRAREVGKRLVSSGHEVVVLAAKTNVGEPPYEILDGMRLYHKKVLPDWIVRRFPAPHYLPLAASSLFLMFHLYFFLKREKFDAIREDLSPFPPSFLLALIRLSTPKRIAVVYNLSGTFVGWLRSYGPLYGTFGFVFDRLLRSGRLKYDRIVCGAKWLADELKQILVISGKVSYVPNGIDLERFSKKDSPRIGCLDWKLLSVGRLVEMKGHRYLIEAIARLKPRYPQIKLTLLGKGPLKDPLLRLSRRLGVESQVKIMSRVSYEELPRIYRQFDFFVLPSFSEGEPVTLFEAMAIQLPIVASNIPGVRGILDENSGTLMASRSVSDLVEKLQWGFEHPEEVARKVAAAYAMVKQYDWNMVVTREVNEILNKITSADS